MNILTVVYGQKHIDMMKKGLLKSLSFRGNKHILYEMNATWVIYTDESSREHLEKMIYAYLPELHVDIRSVVELRDRSDLHHSAIYKMIERSLKEDKLFLMAPPDTIFGDYSIGGMLSHHKNKGDCVAVAHPRVLPEILDESFLPSLGNDELCSLAWKHLHKAWTDAERGHINQNSYMGGVEWWKTSDKIVRVVHRLPTIYLCDFNQGDLDYFNQASGAGHYDHEWPQTLVLTGRQQYVSSSHQAFIVEITDKDKNVPPLVPGHSDGFWRSLPHNEHNAKLPVDFWFK